ncbi:glycosyltransferase family 2 protein [Castellaniella sp.]|uniref:glycosyltransferase family 2 protein n=1 Tax=Castellaniella sp. TaxID=1955812 RepID=UPI002AFF1E9D|nr:glycosyltransferase family 2 protein [Castellaniella sp.]
MLPNPRIALLIPCYNEALTVAQVVHEFRVAIPDIQAYVFDNGSDDSTVDVARAAGAQVHRVAQRGKGSVVRRMFADIEADYYIMVDGDATYDAASVPAMLATLIDQHLDMLVGCRSDAGQAENYRRGHRLGNRLLTGSVRHIFGGSFSDMLSGYRVFSRRYVKSFPGQSAGFEIETELTVHALEMAMPWGEMPTPYGARPNGSVSKLSTWRDGLRIFAVIMRLYMLERPLILFGLLGALLCLLGVGLSVPLFIDYAHSGLVPRLPTAVLVTGLCVVGLLLAAVGVVLDSLARARREIRRLAYLAVPLQ